MKNLLVICLFLSGIAGAQLCPVTIEKAQLRTTLSRSTPYYTTYDVSLALDYTNTSDKEISALEFGAEGIDAFGNTRPTFTDFTLHRKLKAGKKGYGVWDVDYTTSGTPDMPARAWVRQVAFKDGTQWKDDGSKQCIFEPKVKTAR